MHRATTAFDCFPIADAHFERQQWRGAGVGVVLFSGIAGPWSGSARRGWVGKAASALLIWGCAFGSVRFMVVSHSIDWPKCSHTHRPAASLQLYCTKIAIPKNIPIRLLFAKWLFNLLWVTHARYIKTDTCLFAAVQFLQTSKELVLLRRAIAWTKKEHRTSFVRC